MLSQELLELYDTLQNLEEKTSLEKDNLQDLSECSDLPYTVSTDLLSSLKKTANLAILEYERDILINIYKKNKKAKRISLNVYPK